MWYVWYASLANGASSDVLCPVLYHTSCQLHRHRVVLSCAHVKRCTVQQLFPADIFTSFVCVSSSVIPAVIVQYFRAEWCVVCPAAMVAAEWAAWEAMEMEDMAGWVVAWEVAEA